VEREQSKKLIWTGRILSWLTVAFLVMDGAMKLVKPAPVVEATVQLGYPESDIIGIGLLLLACTALYVFPRTRHFGAILLTGYLGGAVASQLRAGNGWFNIVFPVILGSFLWAGVWLTDRTAST
jgi:hypothetical protein